MTESWAMHDMYVTYTEDDKLLRDLLTIKGVEKFGTYRDKKRGVYAWQVVYPKSLRQGVEAAIRLGEQPQKATPSEGCECDSQG